VLAIKLFNLKQWQYDFRFISLQFHCSCFLVCDGNPIAARHMTYTQRELALGKCAFGGP